MDSMTHQQGMSSPDGPIIPKLVQNDWVMIARYAPCRVSLRGNVLIFWGTQSSIYLSSYPASHQIAVVAWESTWFTFQPAADSS